MHLTVHKSAFFLTYFIDKKVLGYYTDTHFRTL